MRIAAGGFTNISRDHLDYHPSMADYLAAKLRLFSDLIERRGAAVIDVDHEHAEAVVACAKQRRLRLLTVGRKGEGIRLVENAIEGFAQRLHVVHGGNDYRLRLPLVGDFQVENALVAAGLVIATGGEPAAAFAALARLKGAKGRLELVGEKNGASIFVDYAHKPDALAKALDALRPYASGRLVVVFGAGGDRDPGKRPMMGQIAAAEGRSRRRHRRQSAQRGGGGDSRRDPAGRAGRDRDRRPRRGDPRRDRRAAPRRRAADRRQGP